MGSLDQTKVLYATSLTPRCKSQVPVKEPSVFVALEELSEMC